MVTSWQLTNGGLCKFLPQLSDTSIYFQTRVNIWWLPDITEKKLNQLQFLVAMHIL